MRLLGLARELWVVFRLLGEFRLLGDDLGLEEETEPVVLFVLICLS